MQVKVRNREVLRGNAFICNGWIIRAYDDKTGADFIQRNWKNICTPESVIKDDHRSFVGVFHSDGIKYTVKRFKLQHNRLGFRFASVFCSSLGEIACHNAVALNNAGIKTPPPGFLLQRVKLGAIRDSWIVYQFVPGEEIQPENQLEIVDFVKNMHHNGWVHRDANPTNFLMTESGMVTIDPICVRQSGSLLAMALDVLHLDSDILGTIERYGKGELGVWLSIAKFYRSFMRFYRSIKLLVRKVLRQNEHSGMR